MHEPHPLAAEPSRRYQTAQERAAKRLEKENKKRSIKQEKLQQFEEAVWGSERALERDIHKMVSRASRVELQP